MKQLLTKAGKDAGMGSGELSGLQANLRAICVATAPFVFSCAGGSLAPGVSSLTT